MKATNIHKEFYVYDLLFSALDSLQAAFFSVK